MSNGYSVLHEILLHGIEENASDWHICEGRAIGIRSKGEIVTLGVLAEKSLFDSIVETMVPERARVSLEETGDADFAFVEPEIGRFRANLHLQRGTRALTLRHVKSDVPTVDDLSLPPKILDLIEYKDGIVFVTGSTGSGKSTTMACMLNHLNANYRKHVITVEDPIEYTFEDKKCIFEQREVGLDTSSFDSALKHALRQDPDVIVIGELRSKESVQTALSAAETGHLLLTTLHTITASQSIERILDFFPYEERGGILKALAGSLRAIVCQRLVPRTFEPGLVPINEILINTPVIRRLLLDDKVDKLEAAIAASQPDGMQSFNQALLHRINEGAISEETGLSYSSKPESLKMNLKGIFLSEDGGIVG